MMNRNGANRRGFLAGAATLAAGVATSQLTASAATGYQDEAESKLKLGLVTYNWGKEWDVPTLIAHCAETGFEGVELRSTHRHGVEISLDAAARREIKKRFADSPVECVGPGSACEYHSADPAVVRRNVEETKAFVKLCHDIGGSGVKVRPNGLPDGVPVEKTLEQIGRALNVCGRFAADYGVQIRVEVHGRGTQEILNMKKIMDVAGHPSVVVCWNCNAADLQGAGLAANYEMLADRLGTVHIHDLRPGKNDYPWDDLFPRLLECDAPGFTGWCLLEDGKVPEDIVGAMRENRQRFDQLVSALSQ